MLLKLSCKSRILSYNVVRLGLRVHACRSSKRNPKQTSNCTGITQDKIKKMKCKCKFTSIPDSRPIAASLAYTQHTTKQTTKTGTQLHKTELTLTTKLCRCYQKQFGKLGCLATMWCGYGSLHTCRASRITPKQTSNCTRRLTLARI